MSDALSHQARTDAIAEAIARRRPPPGESFPCPYLVGRSARNTVLFPAPLLPGIYHSMMDLNFRRLGGFFYRPCCSTCDQCRMIRIRVPAFRPSRSQRRCRVRNRDLVATWGQPLLTPAKHALYQRYLISRHDGTMDGSVDEMNSFLYQSPLQTLELVASSRERLVAVAIADLEPAAMSAVYTYFEPDLPERSLGTWCVLALIDECRRRRRDWLYLGYWVSGCRRMAYKTAFRPHELLGADLRWTPSDREEER